MAEKIYALAQKDFSFLETIIPYVNFFGEVAVKAFVIIGIIFFCVIMLRLSKNKNS